MKRIIKEYLYFSKQERIAVFVLLFLMGAFIALPHIYAPKFETPVINQALLDWMSDTSEIDRKEETGTLSYPADKATLFVFDPNTISGDDWLRLGISARTVRTILNYRSKGGQFRKPDDIRKIWGISKTDAERLLPFVRIKQTAGFDRATNAGNGFPASTKKEPAPIDINTAGTAEWASLPGIGEVLGNRIMRYREKTGGFRSVEQVRKTYGISDSLYNAIKPYLQLNTTTIPKINLNTASAYTLSQAGIDYRFARELVRYRDQHGLYRSVEELHKLLEMPDSAWQNLIMRIKIE